MLKACWDCLAGYDLIRDQTHNEEPYGTHLNGVTHQVPPWPQPQFERENMFLLPKQLSLDDNITLTGNLLSDPKIIKIALITGLNSPDYKNVACELEVDFPSNNGDNKIVLKVTKDGYDEIINDSNLATDFFISNEFSVRFKVRNGSLDIYIGPSFLDYVQLKHNFDDIRFIAVSGDVQKVKKLDFEFS